MKFLRMPINKTNSIKKIKNGFVVIGDVHLSNVQSYSTVVGPGRRTSRLNDLYEILSSAADIAEKFEIPLIINGDVLTARTLDYEVERVLVDFLINHSSLEILINLGNHDFDGDYTVLQPLIDLHTSGNVRIISEPTNIDFGPMTLNFVPWLTMPATIRALARLSSTAKKSQYHVMFLHTTFSYAKWSSNTSSKGGLSQGLFCRGKLAYVKLIVASHIHKYQEICEGKGFYTSSPMPNDFGERSKDYGFHIIDIDNDIRYFIQPNFPIFKYIDYINVKHITEEDVSGNIIKIIHIKEIDKAKISERLKKLGARFVSFKRKHRKPIQPTTDINTDELTAKSILIEYSKILAKTHKVDQTIIEEYGAKILEKAEVKNSI